MQINIKGLERLAQQKIDAAEDLLRRLPDDPLDLHRRLAEEIVELGGWLLCIIEAITPPPGLR